MARIMSTRGYTGDDQDEWAHLLERLAKHMHDTWSNAAALADLITHIAAHAEDVPDYEDNGCISCRRNANQWEPVWEGRYRNYCRFCGDWKAANQELPALAILKARHRGERITTALMRRHGL